jgi:predicted nucleic acid-binding protein
VILTDAGPLVALGDAGDARHALCVRTAATLIPPFFTTWPSFTEALHILGSRCGWPEQQGLWRLQQTGRLELAELSDAATRRAAELMGKYADLPMDLADATLVALAEERDERRIFTLDSAFHVYRLHGRRAFEVLPG